MASAYFKPVAPNLSSNFNPDLNGFDDTEHIWQMVPYKGTRFLEIHPIGTTRWTVESLDPFVATVTQADATGEDPRLKNVCRIDGHHRGKTFVIVREPSSRSSNGREIKGKELRRLEVEVKHLKTPFIQFFLVSDKGGHKTSFSEEDTKKWLAYMNDRIFEPQINVRFNYLRTRPIIIDEDLGEKIDFKSVGPFVGRKTESERIWHKITDFGMLNAHVFNVFCVWDFINHSDEGQMHAAFVAVKTRITAAEMEKSGATYNMCMLKEDNESGYQGSSGSHKYILAHEAGHYLARMPYHTDHEDLLMTPGTLGERLLKTDADRMNKAQ